MSEGTQNVQQQSQDEQALQEARDFFGQSMGRILGQMESDNTQLQNYMQQLPEETQAQVQQMTESYNQFAGTITQAAQDAGVQDSVLQSAQQARQNADQASGQGPTDVAAQQAQQVTEQAQDTVGGLTDQAQDAAGQATDQVGQVADQAQDAVGDATDQAEDAVDQAQDVAGQMAENLPEGYEALGQPFTDDQGNQVLQGQDEEGNTVVVRRSTDEAGNTIDSIFDAQGNLLDENIIEEGAEDEAEEEEEPQDVASQMAQALPEGYQIVGEPTTDEEGNQVIQAQDEQGNTVTIRREIDDQGNVVDRVYDAEGNLMDERIVPNPVEEEVEQPVEDSSSADSNTTTVEEKKGEEGLLGGGLLRLDLLPPMAKTEKASRKVKSSRAAVARSIRCRTPLVASQAV